MLYSYNFCDFLIIISAISQQAETLKIHRNVGFLLDSKRFATLRQPLPPLVNGVTDHIVDASHYYMFA